MECKSLYIKALNNEKLSFEEGLFLYENAPLSELMFLANELRKKFKPERKVGWIIDRNINITNGCFVQCKFCNFHRKINDSEVFITSISEYKEKINELFFLGGNQILLQGGLHPNLNLKFYCNLFENLKNLFPNLKLHALGPAEIIHLTKIENLSICKVLEFLIESGLDSLPGAGAEILNDRVRKIISPAKCTAAEWSAVMHEAHRLNLPTSATMMFGHIETFAERIEHLILLRDLQEKKPKYSKGFITFVLWTFQGENTVLQQQFSDSLQKVSASEYLRMVSISRVLLNNIENIQTSWLTVGKEIAQLSLYAGANDFGSIMIEENVVKSAGANYSFDASEIQKAICEAGFLPQQRNQKYEFI